LLVFEVDIQIINVFMQLALFHAALYSTPYFQRPGTLFFAGEFHDSIDFRFAFFSVLGLIEIRGDFLTIGFSEFIFFAIDVIDLRYILVVTDTIIIVCRQHCPLFKLARTLPAKLKQTFTTQGGLLSSINGINFTWQIEVDPNTGSGKVGNQQIDDKNDQCQNAFYVDTGIEDCHARNLARL
jgi:hypothetical protein